MNEQSGIDVPVDSFSIPEGLRDLPAVALVICYGNKSGRVVDHRFLDPKNADKIQDERRHCSHFYHRVEVNIYRKYTISGGYQ